MRRFLLIRDLFGTAALHMGGSSHGSATCARDPSPTSALSDPPTDTSELPILTGPNTSAQVSGSTISNASTCRGPSTMDVVSVGGLDEYLVRRNQLDLCTIVHVSALLSRSIPCDRLYAALATVVSNNLCLSLNIFKSESKKPIRRAVKKVDLEKQVQYRPNWSTIEHFIDDQYENIGAKFHYDVEEPLWRVYILGKDESLLVFAFDHAVMDGSSSISIVKQLISALNEETLTNTTVIPPSTSQDKLLHSFPQTNVTIPFAIKLAFRVFKEWVVRPKKFCGPPARAPLDSKSIVRVVSTSQTTKLIQEARSRKISLHVLLFTALLETVVANYLDSNCTVSLSSTVNARRYLDTEAMGNYFYNFSHSMTHDFESFKSEFDGSQFNDAWAREYSAALSTALKDPSDMAQLVGIMKYINLKKYLLSELRKGRRHDSIEISNLGAHDFEDGEYRVLELALGQPVAGVNAPFCISVASLRNGPMTLVVSVAGDDEDGKTKCNEVWNGMKRILDHLTESFESTKMTRPDVERETHPRT